MMSSLKIISATIKRTSTRTIRNAHLKTNFMANSPRLGDQNILRPDLQTLVLVFPNHRRIKIQKLRHDFVTDTRQQTLGVFRRVLTGVIVIAHALALAIIAVSDGVD